MLNRLLTPKEQWLLIGLTVAMLLGAAALWFNGQKSRQDSALAVVHPATAQPAKNQVAEHPAPVAAAAAPVAIPAQETTNLPEVAVEETPKKVGVAVWGAVEKEGLYWLEPKARVLDLLAAAGGPREGADLQAINRAAFLLDGTTLSVPWADYTAAENERAQYVRWSAGVYLNPPEYLNPPWSDQVRGQYAQLTPKQSTGTSLGGAKAATDGCIHLSTATLAELDTLPGIGPELGQRILEYRDQHGFQQISDLMNVNGIAEKRFNAIAALVCL